MKLFVALVLAALLVVGLAKHDDLEFWAEIDSDGPVDAMAFPEASRQDWVRGRERLPSVCGSVV